MLFKYDINTSLAEKYYLNCPVLFEKMLKTIEKDFSDVFKGIFKLINLLIRFEKLIIIINY